jgi:hypothetical protein
VTQVNFAGAHDLLIKPNGDILAAAYSGSNSDSSGIWQFDSGLGSKTQIIADGTNGLARPTGLSLSATGTLYVQANVQGGANTVFQYSIDPTSGDATYVTKTTSSDLNFDFGSDLGPDGNLYIAALGGGESHQTFSASDGYTNGVYEFNTTTTAVSLAVPGWVVGTGGPSDGFESPKYLQFSTSFVDAPDAGAPTPEPGSIALLGGLSVGGMFFRARRKRRTV